MSKKILKVVGGAILTILMVAGFAQVWVSGQEVNGQSEKGLTGSWDVQVTIRDCASGTPLISFPAMMTYHQGGTMTEAANDATALRRTGGQGVWAFQFERRYSAAFHFFRYNGDGSYAGTTKIRKRLEVSKSGTSYSATTTFDLLDASGTTTASGCATEAGTRFE
jgi:hypothetical protein